jgi:hypothetical protein
MSTATVHQHRPILPVFNVLVASAALTLGAVAIATDDVSSVTRQPAPAVESPTVEAPAVPASTRAESAISKVDAGQCAFPRPGLVVRC